MKGVPRFLLAFVCLVGLTSCQKKLQVKWSEPDSAEVTVYKVKPSGKRSDSVARTRIPGTIELKPGNYQVIIKPNAEYMRKIHEQYLTSLERSFNGEIEKAQSKPQHDELTDRKQEQLEKYSRIIGDNPNPTLYGFLTIGQRTPNAKLARVPVNFETDLLQNALIDGMVIQTTTRDTGVQSLAGPALLLDLKIGDQDPDHD